MASSLRLQVIAEGIEEREQERYLIEHGCAYGQGYYYARPMPEAEATSILREHAEVVGSNRSAG